jgi:hypothetical protein
MRHAYVRLSRPARLIAALAWSVLVFATADPCLSAEKKPVDKELPNAEWKSVEIQLFVNELDQVSLVPKIKTVTDPKQTQEIAQFFPGVGTGWRSDRAAGWVRYLEFVFTKKDGGKVKVLCDFTSWSEGRGDRPLAPGFEKYLWKLFKDEAKN